MRRVALAILLLADGALAADPCVAPTSWPLGHHDHQFQRPPGSGAFVTASGWDPADAATNDAAKAGLTAKVTTYPVGLPNNQEPANLPRDWTSSLPTTWTPASLAAAGLPTVTLTGVSGTVYHVDNYDGLTSPKAIKLGSGAKVAVSRSAFQSFNVESGASTLIVVDSLIDQNSGSDQPFTNGQTGTNTWLWWVAYSEVLGGVDSSKGKWMAFYRSHIHGATKIPSDAHTDGIQLVGDEAVFAYENNIDFLFRKQNGGFFLGDAGSSLTHRSKAVRIINNLIGGGDWNIKADGMTYDDVHVCGNRFLASSTQASWIRGPIEARSQYNSLENNAIVTGQTSGVDQSGRAWSTADTVPTPGPVKSAVASEVAKIETWVSEVRAAAGYTGIALPAPPSSPQPSPPASPVLLP